VICGAKFAKWISICAGVRQIFIYGPIALNFLTAVWRLFYTQKRVDGFDFDLAQTKSRNCKKVQRYTRSVLSTFASELGPWHKHFRWFSTKMSVKAEGGRLKAHKIYLLQRIARDSTACSTSLANTRAAKAVLPLFCAHTARVFSLALQYYFQLSAKCIAIKFAHFIYLIWMQTTRFRGTRTTLFKCAKHQSNGLYLFYFSGAAICMQLKFSWRTLRV